MSDLSFALNLTYEFFIVFFSPFLYVFLCVFNGEGSDRVVW